VWGCVIYAVSCLAWLHAATASAAEAPRHFVRVRSGQRGFVVGPNDTSFTPWGFNYDHDRQGRLLEDYWHDEWPAVVEDFYEMKELGANVIRIHLQFGRFLKSPTDLDASNLESLRKLVQLAEREGLYLDITGLGCYHKADVPEWYDRLDEAGRWKAQARFWEAIARTCAASPAIFCYDLMNEPVSPAGRGQPDHWLGPAFAGKHFVQYISTDPAGRERPEIGRQWIETLTTAIRHVDPHHLVTVGLVDWSLERPGLTSGMVPSRIADKLDFLCVHLYPRDGKLEEDIETLAGFAAVGKPVVIEETFPLRCSGEAFRTFLVDSRRHADGWIGFYWGQSRRELEARRDDLRAQAKPGDEAFREAIATSLMLQWLETFHQLHPRR